MNKNVFKIVCIVMVVFVIVFAVYKFDSANRAEKSMLEVAEQLVDSICDKDFDKIKMHIKNTEGAELSDDEIYNFLLNTDFYRLTFYVDDECNPVYETKFNYLNSHKGYVIFSFSALDGDLVTNTLEYVNTGVNEYFITNDIDESDLVVKKYPFAKDLANGEEFLYDDHSQKNYFFEYRYGEDENNNLYIEVIEEAKDDFKIAMLNSLEKTLEDKEGEYRYEWNEDCSVFSAYYDEGELSAADDARLNATAIFNATAIQALNGQSEWKLTINYYDYSNEELSKSITIR